MILGAINTNTNNYICPQQAIRGDNYRCIECGQRVILRRGNERKAHWAHYNKDSNCDFYCNPTDSQIHKCAQLLLKSILEYQNQNQNQISLRIYNECCECSKTVNEILIPNILPNVTIQIEHRFIFNETSKIADIMYLSNNNPMYIFEIFYTHKTNELDRPEPWFELNAENLINNYWNYNSMNNIELKCIREKICDDCFNNQINNQINNQTNMNNGIIYFNQRGAGCGKTYESIQLLQNDDRFINKETFIYLTKMHSAKDVIYNELMEQQMRGNLNILEMRENIKQSKKQYYILYQNTNTNKKVEIIIGTIDSFNFAIVDKQKINDCYDYFKGIVETIKDGNILLKNDRINYARKTPIINTNCLIIIDEAQDLCKEYIEAFNAIITQTNIDVYVIGDKLQSIWGENNIHTYVNMNNLNTNIVKSTGINKVMRFHNTNFIDFVNKIIPFEKYDLPPITEICNINCKYNHENDIIPYHIFQTPDFQRCDLETMKCVIEDILKYMNLEINKYNYLPNNFMFIFPILSKNKFATMLEMSLQEFWINKFNDPNYQNILKLNDYWKNNINNNNFYKYVFLHKSDEGKSINLQESENATRILSIHSSKGNGCEVVFVLGINESSLVKFSKEKCNLVYDSLLHVAITRQKKSIYFGIENNDDDISNRFKCFNIEKKDYIEPPLRISKFNNIKKINNFINDDDEIFTNLYKNIIEPNNYQSLLSPEEMELSDSKPIIDWGHHIIRHSVILYYFMYNVMDNDVVENEKCKDQFFTVLRVLSKKKIVCVCHDCYIEAMNDIYTNNKNNSNNGQNNDNEQNNSLTENLNNKENIHLLQFNTNENTKYNKYTKILEKIIGHIQTKIREYLRVNKLPPLCPIECIVLVFIRKMFDDGICSDLSIMDLYTIIHCYDSCFCDVDEEHTEINNCICSVCFDNSNDTNLTLSTLSTLSTNSYDDIKNSIVNHYDNIQYIKEIYNNYKKYLVDNLPNENFKYNTYHDVKMRNKYNSTNKSENFIITDDHDVIGYSENNLIYTLIKPQFNKLNFNNIICEILLKNFIILNCCGENNQKRYSNKNNYACIVTLDSNEPIFCKLNMTKNDPTMVQIVKKYLISTYSKHHKYVYKYYEYCKNNRPNGKNSLVHTRDKLSEIISMPHYIINYFNDVNMEIIKNPTNKQNILNEKINYEDKFLSNLNESLVINVDNFLCQTFTENTDY